MLFGSASLSSFQRCSLSCSGVFSSFLTSAKVVLLSLFFLGVCEYSPYIGCLGSVAHRSFSFFAATVLPIFGDTIPARRYRLFDVVGWGHPVMRRQVPGPVLRHARNVATWDRQIQRQRNIEPKPTSGWC